LGGREKTPPSRRRHLRQRCLPDGLKAVITAVQGDSFHGSFFAFLVHR
jgi:hypothetical protein